MTKPKSAGTIHTSLQHQPFLLRPFSSSTHDSPWFYGGKTILRILLHSHLLMDKVYRSFARFAANVACCTGLFGFAMWIVAITILLITHDKLPLNPEAYAYLPAPCYTELECDIVAYPTAILNVWVVLLGLFYIIAILISSLARQTRFLSFITLGMCTVLAVLLYTFFFRYGLKLLAVLNLQEPVTRDRALKYVANSGYIYLLVLSMTFWLSATVMGGGITLFFLSK